MNPRTAALEFPLKGRYYDSTAGAVTFTNQSEKGHIFTLTDTVLTSVTFDSGYSPNIDADGVVAGTTILAGMTLPGLVSGFQVLSGVICIIRQS